MSSTSQSCGGEFSQSFDRQRQTIISSPPPPAAPPRYLVPLTDSSVRPVGTRYVIKSFCQHQIRHQMGLPTPDASFDDSPGGGRATNDLFLMSPHKVAGTDYIV